MLVLRRADAGQHPRQLTRPGLAGVGGASFGGTPLDVAKPLQCARLVTRYVPRPLVRRAPAEDLHMGSVMVDQRPEQPTQRPVRGPGREAFREHALLVRERRLEQALVGRFGRPDGLRSGGLVLEQVVDGPAAGGERRGANGGGNEETAATDESRGR